jgi:hypothetical protein
MARTAQENGFPDNPSIRDVFIIRDDSVFSRMSEALGTHRRSPNNPFPAPVNKVKPPATHAKVASSPASSPFAMSAAAREFHLDRTTAMADQAATPSNRR